MKKSLSLIVLFTCLISVRGTGVLEDIVTAIEKAIDYYSSNYADMNIDGIFGIRMLEGQLNLAAEFLKTNPRLPDDLQQIYIRIVNSQRRAKDIGDVSLPSLKKSDIQYYNLMSPLVERPWSFERDYRRLNSTLKWRDRLSSEKEVSWKEMQSDGCISELLGTREGMPCNISKECIKMVSVQGMTGYGITHQLLYTMIAEQTGCSADVNSELLSLPNRSISTEHLQAEFCVNNFYETSDSVLIQHGVIDLQLQDLFLEQEFVCSMLGYFEFLHIEWLRQIISWQMPSGCYGETENEEMPGPAMELRHGKDTSHDKPAEAIKYVDSKIIDGRPVPFDHHLPVDQRKRRQMGNLGSLDQITPFVHREPTITIQTLDERRLNLRKTGLNISQIHRPFPVLRYTPMETERGKLGERKIKPAKTSRNRRESRIKDGGKRLGYFDHGQGKVGDTRVRFSEAGEESKLRDKRESRPVADQNMMAHQESFSINRHISRRLLYEKVLKDGCLAHKTAVAMGALSQYLRFVLLANSSGIDALKRLSGINYLMHPSTLLLSPSSLLPLSKPVEPSSSADELYEADANVEVLATGLPMTKSGEDELLLYDELVNMKVGAESASKALHKNQVKALHNQGMVDIEGISSVSSTYGIIIVVTAFVLLLLYRSLCKRRFGVHNRHDRWR